MTRTACTALTLVLLAGCLVFAPTLRAADTVLGIQDEASFFKFETIDKVRELAQQIKVRYGKDVRIDTVKSVPDNRVREVKAMTRKARERFFGQWARERAEQAGINGVYVLVCKDPPYSVVMRHGALGEDEFTDADRARLARLLPDRWNKKYHDGKVIDAVAGIEDALAYNLRGPEPVPPGRNGWLTILWIIAGILGVWVVIGAFRALTAPRTPPPPAESGAVATQSGLFGNLLGGMFGSRTGYWITEGLRRPVQGTPNPTVTPPTVEELAAPPAKEQPAPEVEAGDRTP